MVHRHAGAALPSPANAPSPAVCTWAPRAVAARCARQAATVGGIEVLDSAPSRVLLGAGLVVIAGADLLVQRPKMACCSTFSPGTLCCSTRDYEVGGALKVAIAHSRNSLFYKAAPS